MATLTTLPGAPGTEHRGLSFWMERTESDLEKVRNAPDPGAVHDLRVALRRCRSVAAAIEEVDPHPGWPELRKTARKLFQALGALRDEQVLGDWIKLFAPGTDPVGAHLLAAIDERKPALREALLRSAAKFDLKAWRHLGQALRRRSRLVPSGGLAAECLALERLEEAKELHARALRTEKRKPWHALRIGLKRFRYTVESLLPEQYQAWSESLKRVQDLLGDIHDLDVLATRLEESDAIDSEESLTRWRESLAGERRQRLETYRQLMLGKTSFWNTWQAGLPANGRRELAVQAKLRATGRAADSRWRRTTQTTRIALSIFEALKRARACPAAASAEPERMLLAAAWLTGAGSTKAADGEKSPQKIACKFVRKLPRPPGWTAEEWETLACVVRYHRGAEPSETSGPYSKLPAARHSEVRFLAGLLRLARALRKSGIQNGSGFQAEKTAEAVLVRVPGLPDNLETASRLARGKHLLESLLGLHLIVKWTARQGKVIPLSRTFPPQAQDESS